MPTALIIGAGIGGLAAAISLAQKGWQVRVAEQAPRLEEVGAGIQLSPNGVQALRRLGVPLGAHFQPEAIEMRLGQSGKRVFRIELGEYAQHRWGAPYATVHRADLLAALLERAAAMEQISIELGTRLTSYTADSTVTAQFESGAPITADLLVGADGLHSTVRAQMHGADRPRFTGNVAWRLTVPTSAVAHPPPPTSCAWAGEGKHAVTYYLRGGDLINFVGITETPGTEHESWTGLGQLSDLKALYEGWHPSVTSVIDAAETARHWALYDRAPLPFWSDGPVVILGDAAHPALPSLAQGACMALEDAVALGDCMAQADPLATFYTQRIERVSKVQRKARANLDLFHKRSLTQKALHYGPLYVGSRILPRAAHRQLDWLYGLKP